MKRFLSPYDRGSNLHGRGSIFHGERIFYSREKMENKLERCLCAPEIVDQHVRFMIFNREALIHRINIRDILQSRMYEVSGVDILLVVSQMLKDIGGISQGKTYSRSTGTGAFSSRNPLTSIGEIGFQI